MPSLHAPGPKGPRRLPAEAGTPTRARFPLQPGRSTAFRRKPCRGFSPVARRSFPRCHIAHYSCKTDPVPDDWRATVQPMSRRSAHDAANATMTPARPDNPVDSRSWPMQGTE